jgi:hypothetical protein
MLVYNGLPKTLVGLLCSNVYPLWGVFLEIRTAKDRNKIQSLPITQTNLSFWYHQIDQAWLPAYAWAEMLKHLGTDTWIMSSITEKM